MSTVHHHCWKEDRQKIGIVKAIVD